MGNQILFKVIIEISSTINYRNFILFKIIERIFLVSYHLQLQGSVDAYNKTIQYFSYFCNRFGKRWVWFRRMNAWVFSIL